MFGASRTISGWSLSDNARNLRSIGNPDGLYGNSGQASIPREHRRIFRRFYRIDQRLASATSGVGLGLSIVELIANAHGGSVSVQSAEGAGSTFTLYVPSAPGALA